MKPRLAALTAFASLSALVLGALLFAVTFGSAQGLPPRIAFQVATGSTGGTYFPVGELIAGLISNPPGVDRCEKTNVCGPPGLILSARTSDGAVANVLAVNAGRVDSGLAQGDVLADAVAGKGVFRTAQTHIRVIAALFPEDVHLVVARKSRIARVSDLRGKRVSLGAEGSGTNVTARAILAAYGISPSAIKARHDSSDVDAQLLQSGKLDAFFFVGGTPVPLMDDLLARGVARLVPIGGKQRDRLLKLSPNLSSDVIAAGIYPGTGAVQTVSVRALWVVRDSAPDSVVYGVVKALFNPANRDLLYANLRVARFIRLDTATAKLPAPLHPGAMRFYREAGKLAWPNNKAGKI